MRLKMVFAGQGGGSNTRLGPFSASLAIHVGVVALMITGHERGWTVDVARETPRRSSLGDHKIVWYKTTVDLPPVAPTEAIKRPVDAAAEVPSPQKITAGADSPESRRQMVLQSPPEIRLEQDLRSPNVLVFNPPAPAPPKPRFVPPPQPERSRVGALPELETPQVVAAAPAAQFPVALQPARMPAPRFQMPQPGAARAAPAAIAAEAPQIGLAASTDDTLSRLEGPVTVQRPQFRMPEGRGSSPEPVLLPGPDISAPAIGAPQQTPTVIVGLDPVPARLEAPLPAGNRSAQFSAGPQAGGDGNGGLAASARAEIRVPNLSIAPVPAAAAAPAPTITRPQPSGSANTRAAFRKELLASLSARLPASAVSSLDKPERAGSERLLHGSSVYTMAIDMPNITSYEGSWTLRFTELGGSSPDDVLTSPVAMRKVDPKYIASAAAEGVEGKVLLYAVIRRDGRVDRIRLVQGIDERLDLSAVAAFAKWEFQPATRNGQPVDLEAVVQIPFRVGPRRKN